tara:strand:+ start:6046 stop:6300 length:255 start_codon:yes stop_codon:yes gene_type:complete
LDEIKKKKMKKYLMILAMSGLMVAFSAPAIFASNTVNTEISTEKEKKEKKKKKKKSSSESATEKKGCSGKSSGDSGCCHGKKAS